DHNDPPSRLTNRHRNLQQPHFPSMYGAIMSFRVTGRTSKADNKAISEYLFDRYGIFTVERDGPVNGSCVRVIPAVFTLRE
ncbi:hypothetical protein, partial [Saccharopolyspora tripterygii]